MVSSHRYDMKAAPVDHPMFRLHLSPEIARGRIERSPSRQWCAPIRALVFEAPSMHVATRARLARVAARTRRNAHGYFRRKIMTELRRAHSSTVAGILAVDPEGV